MPPEPDSQRFDLAAKKQLHQNLKQQVERMLKDPKSTALTENFAAQWLHLRLLKTHAPDAKLFPDFDDALRNAMVKETEAGRMPKAARATPPAITRSAVSAFLRIGSVRSRSASGTQR